MNKYSGFTWLEPLSEEKFLSNELGITWTTIDELMLYKKVISNHKKRIRTLIIINSDMKWIGFLSNLPNDSVVVIQLSDETLLPDLMNLVSIKSVSKLYRNYSIRKINLLSFVISFPVNFFAIKKNHIGLPVLLQAYKQGYRMRQRATKLNKTKIMPVAELPLGYTNKFANEFCSRFFKEKRVSSLFYNSLIEQYSPHRSNKICFSGGPGSLPRKIALHEAIKSRDSEIKVSAHGWNGTIGIGDSASEYVDSLLANKFSLCPPGTVSNESFRFFESLICQSLPIASKFSITQGTKTELFGTGDNHLSWKRIIKSHQRKFSNESIRLTTIKDALEDILNRLTNIKKDLSDLNVA